MRVVNEWNGEVENIKFVASKYANNGSLAVQAYCEDGEPYATITVNLPDSDMNGENMAFLDTNNCDSLIRQMADAGYVELLPMYVNSGFCSYPLGAFTDKFFESEVVA